MKNKKISPYLFILGGFLALIILGTLLLKLPFSTTNGIKWVDSLFTATSAVCVTGLSTIDIASGLTVFGKIVLAVLIQLGGLGIVTLGIFILITIGAKIGIKERVILKEALNQNSLQGLVKLVKMILLTTLVIETFGVILNMFVFTQNYDFWSALGHSVFHSISSFNNAGFVICESSLDSLMNYSNNFLLNFNTCLLIVLGGIGYLVIFDLIKATKTKKLTIHSKIVLTTTAFLIIIPTIIFKLNNSNLSWMESVFQSITCRTAGFSTINPVSLTSASIMIMIFLMFIGASPVSTGGGIKTTTFYTILKAIYSFARGKPCVTHKRKIYGKSIEKAFLITILAISYIFIVIFSLALLEPNMTIIDITFETVSAFATVGLSLGVTSSFTVLSKIILCITMFFGRVGLLSVASLWNSHWNVETEGTIEYIDEKIIIG